MSNFYRLFLDDVRMPKDVNWVCLPPGPWTIVRNYSEFVKVITERGIPGFISFDHDLADEHYRPSMYARDGHYSNYYSDGTFKEKTGYCCAKWLIERCQNFGADIPEFTCHSKNPIGKQNITTLLTRAKLQ
jgi:hypothetical protein